MLILQKNMNLNYVTIKNFASNIYFRGENTDNSSMNYQNINDRDILTAINSGRMNLYDADNNGNTVLHRLANNNKVYLVSILLLKPENQQFVGIKNKNGQTPIDMASSDEMKNILLNYYNKDNEIKIEDFYKNLKQTKKENIDNSKLEDAKIISAKQQVQPMTINKNSTAENVVNEEKQEEKQEENISYFDSFVEVENSVDNEVINPENLRESILEKRIVAENSEGIDIIKDFSLLEVYSDEPSSFDDIIGLDDIKKELDSSIIKPLNDPKVLKSHTENNIQLPNGILFSVPENGLAFIKAFVNEANLPVIILDDPNQLNGIKKAINNRFNETGKRTIILAKGFDKFFENMSNPIAQNNFKNELRLIKKSGALFIATTDDKSKISCDFMQSAIIDKVFEIKKPSLTDRQEFITQFFNARNEIFELVNDKNNIFKIAQLTDNLTYADIKRILEQTATLAISNEEKVSYNAFESTLKQFSDDKGLVPINEANKTANYDTEMFRRIPIESNEIMNLDELGGMPEVKARLRELYINPMKNIDEMQKIFGDDAIPDGAIFYGAPGNGKTLTARVLARELGLPYYETRLSDFGTALVHESGKAFKRYADQLDKKFKETGERSVWFLDEFDGVGASREGNNNHADRELVDTLLQELTNPSKRGYILIAATNNLENVDSALKRRGRLGNWIEFKNPNQEERKDTIKKNLLKHDFTKEFANDDKFVSSIAKELDGFSMSSIVNILKDTKRDFYLNKTDFKAALNKALDDNAKREMGEFCGKTGLKQHQYEDWSFNSLDELKGIDDVIQILRETIINSWDPKVRASMIANKRIPSGGFILEGPPGTGKTTLIETLAREMGVPLYKMNYNQEGNQYIHQTSKHVQEIFERLSLESKVIKKPVMLFFDEAEKFFPRNAENHQIEEVNTYKELMNTAASKGIILAGATNHIDLVNQEIIGNPRRMGNVIHCGNPTEDGIKSLIEKMFKDLPIMEKNLDKDDINEITMLSLGMSIGVIVDNADKIIVKAIKNNEKLNPSKIIEGFKTLTKKVHV